MLNMGAIDTLDNTHNVLAYKGLLKIVRENVLTNFGCIQWAKKLPGTDSLHNLKSCKNMFKACYALEPS